MIRLARTRLFHSSVLWRRKAYDLFHQTWNFHSPAFIRLCRATQRAFLTNVLFFRHTGELALRRLHERYWVFNHRALRHESRATQVQRILLGGCIISFAQDKISDDELISTIKNLSVNPAMEDFEAEPSAASSNNEQTLHPSPIMSDSETNTPNQTTQSFSPQPGDPFSNPPLTLFVRDLRQELLRYAVEFLHPPPPHEEKSIEVPVCEATEPMDSNSMLDSHFSSILAGLNFQPDGTGFVDETWDLVVDKADLRVWRRALDFDANEQPPIHEKVSGQFVMEVPKNGEKPKGRYEYRLCGTFQDISALSFLEVQLNIAYRRSWDSKIVSLEYLNPTSEKNNDSNTSCDVLRWIARFPFPLAQREYVYVRRWWLEPGYSSVKPSLKSNEDSQQPNLSEPALASPGSLSAKPPRTSNENSLHSTSTETLPSSPGRYAVVLSRSSSFPSQEILPPVSGGSSVKRLGERVRQTTVLVKNYRSAMIIESHGQFDKLGMNYYLVYYDDPQLPMGDSALSLVSGKAMNQFMDQLHSAALALNQYGLPVGINPVVFHQKPKDTTRALQAIEPQPQHPDRHGPCDSPSLRRTERPKPRFFADYVSEPTRFSNAAF